MGLLANAITSSDEMTEDLRAHMHAIQENEHNQLEELSSFLTLETNFVQSYLAVLQDVKEGWHGGYAIFFYRLMPFDLAENISL